MKTLCLVCFLAAAGWASAQTGPLDLIRTIPLAGVNGRIDHLAVDLKSRRLFVAALGNDTIEVVGLKAGGKVRSLSGFNEPQGIVYAPSFDKVFVANGVDGLCRILDGRTFKMVGTVAVGDDADNASYDEKKRRVYIGYGEGALAVLDAQTGTRVNDIKLAGHPEAFQLEKNGDRIFVNIPSAGQIAVVDRENKEVAATWPLAGAGENFPMALDEANHRLFVGCRQPARLQAYDTDNGKLVASAKINGDTDDLFYDAGRKRIYLSCGEGFLDVIAQRDADHYETVTNLPTASGARTCLFVPELNLLCLAVPKRPGREAEIRVFAVRP